jgi:hypothetical protein
MSLVSEIAEQPAVAARLLGPGRAAIEAIADGIAPLIGDRAVDHVVIAARGSSDHAAIYAQYLFGVRLRLPVALATPSIVSIYGVEPRFDRSLVIGISQSGRSPDIVEVVAAARRQGAPTIALTNDPGSDLAAAAEHAVDLATGPELAVAATKTYTSELLAIALLVVGLERATGAPAADRHGARPGRHPRRHRRGPRHGAPGRGRRQPPRGSRARPADRRRARLRVRDCAGARPQAQGAGPDRCRPVLRRRLPPRAARPGRARPPDPRDRPVGRRRRRRRRPARAAD